jgi:pilus assembly protein CpaB
MNIPKISLKNLPRSWLILGAAIGIGLLAALAARHFLAQQVEAIEAKNKGQQVQQVVAKVALRKGDPINSDTVAVRPIPAEYAHDTALTPDEFDRFNGSTLAYPVRPGEIIVWAMLEGQRAPTFSARVVQGRRAITFPVDEINSISGMLEPGDQIDLMLSTEINGRTRTLPIVQSLNVMATGQRVDEDTPGNEKRQYSTVTVDTSIEQAQILIAARGKGKLTALLRNPKDQQAMASDNAEIMAVLGLSERLTPKASKNIRSVPVLYGGRSQQQTNQDATNLPAAAGPDAANTTPASVQKP